MFQDIKNNIRRARENHSGFTLIELLIVIVILGVLAGIVVFAVNGITDKGNTAACQSDVKTVEVAGEAYFAQHNAYAADMDALVTAGLLHSAPSTDEVSYVVTGTGSTATLAVKGAAGSACVDYTG